MRLLRTDRTDQALLDSIAYETLFHSTPGKRVRIVGPGDKLIVQSRSSGAEPRGCWLRAFGTVERRQDFRSLFDDDLIRVETRVECLSNVVTFYAHSQIFCFQLTENGWNQVSAAVSRVEAAIRLGADGEIANRMITHRFMYGGKGDRPDRV